MLRKFNNVMQKVSRICALGLFIILFASNGYAKEVDRTRCVLHHTATKDTSIKNIDRYHREVRGFDMVGYHFLIRQDGQIEEGRPLNKIGAHALGRNHWIGIALTGKNFFTVHQLIGLSDLLEKLEVKYIEPHYDDYACPGESLREFVETYNQRED